MTVPLDLTALAREARGGWATATSTIESLATSARRLGWRELSVRAGEEPLSVLQPTTQADAKPRSLSALYGLGEQPLHTDGAHLIRPPDFVALVADAPRPTPTRLWSRLSSKVTVPGDSLRNGIFLVRSGRDSFYAPVYRRGSLRYDPGCMSASDQRARAATEFFSQALSTAVEHEWDCPNQLLLVDNRATLHARSAVKDDAAGCALQRLAFYVDKT